MERGPRPGGRLSLLPLIRRHEDAVEADFAERGWDYRDRYRPQGGPSRLTTRRLLLIVDLVLDRMTSRFWSAVTDSDPLSLTDHLLMQAIEVQTEQEHPWRHRHELAAQAREREARKRQIKTAEKRRRRRVALERNRTAARQGA